MDNKKAYKKIKEYLEDKEFKLVNSDREHDLWEPPTGVYCSSPELYLKISNNPESLDFEEQLHEDIPELFENWFGVNQMEYYEFIGFLNEIIDNICLLYRHDFGLMGPVEKDNLRSKCREWMRAMINNGLKIDFNLNKMEKNNHGEMETLDV